MPAAGLPGIDTENMRLRAAQGTVRLIGCRRAMTQPQASPACVEASNACSPLHVPVGVRIFPVEMRRLTMEIRSP